MENHVSGQVTASAETPNPLAALRQALLAALVGNSLFTAVEQLRANHATHECECAARLALWLRNVQREAARRALLAHAQELAGQWSCLADAATMEADLLQVVKCPRIDRTIAEDLKWLFYDATTDARRRQVVAAAYKIMLRHTGKLTEVLS